MVNNSVRVAPTVLVTLIIVLGSVMYLSRGKGGGVAGENLRDHFDLANRHLEHRVYLSLVLCNGSVIVILSMKKQPTAHALLS